MDCPACKNADAYVGFTTIECQNPFCRYYHPPTTAGTAKQYWSEYSFNFEGHEGMIFYWPKWTEAKLESGSALLAVPVYDMRYETSTLEEILRRKLLEITSTEPLKIYIIRIIGYPFLIGLLIDERKMRPPRDVYKRYMNP